MSAPEQDAMTQAWMKASQQMLEGWTSFWSDPGSAGTKPGFQPLGGMAGFSPPYLSTLIGAGPTNPWFLHQLQELLGEAARLGDDGGWEKSLSRFFQNIQAASSQFTQAPLAGGAMAPLWGAGAGNKLWQEWLQRTGADPEKALLNLPNIGIFSRQLQEAKQGKKLYLEAAQAFQKHNALLAQSHLEALHKIHAQLLQMAKEEEAIQTLSEFRKLCIDHLEQSYYACVMSEEYSSLYGEMVNTSMRYRKYLAESLDREQASAGLPNRQGIKTILQRQQQLLREARANREILDECLYSFAQLREELAHLHISTIIPETNARVATAKSSTKRTGNSSAKGKPKENTRRAPRQGTQKNVRRRGKTTPKETR